MTPDPGQPDASPNHTLLADLTRAMHAVARQERERLDAQMAETENLHVERARLRSAAESKQLTRLAEQDVEDVAERTEALIAQIHRDSEHEIAERRRRLARSLVAHASILDAEIERVRAAAEAYRASLDAFVARLTTESDPPEIARLAGSLPAPPDLEAIRALARSDTVAQLMSNHSPADSSLAPDPRGGDREAASQARAEVVGVMDPGIVDRGASNAVSTESRPMPLG